VKVCCGMLYPSGTLASASISAVGCTLKEQMQAKRAPDFAIGYTFVVHIHLLVDAPATGKVYKLDNLN